MFELICTGRTCGTLRSSYRIHTKQSLWPQLNRSSYRVVDPGHWLQNWKRLTAQIPGYYVKYTKFPCAITSLTRAMLAEHTELYYSTERQLRCVWKRACDATRCNGKSICSFENWRSEEEVARTWKIDAIKRDIRLMMTCLADPMKTIVIDIKNKLTQVIEMAERYHYQGIWHA